MDESRGVIGNRKRVHNEIRVEALVIKNTDFNAVATSRNLSPEEADVLKFDQERSIADTMALKRFYMQNLYCKDMVSRIGIIFAIENLLKILIHLKLKSISYSCLIFEDKIMMRKMQ